MRTALLATFAAALAFTATSAAAQSAQERLDARYDRALAAGYKALTMCSAIANAELNGATRTPESVHEWELRGIQAPLDEIVLDLPYEIVRAEAGHIRYVTADWADDMPPRIARHDSGYGCVTLPIGTDPASLRPELDVPVRTDTSDLEVQTQSLTIPAHDPNVELAEGTLGFVLEAAFDGTYGDNSRTTAVLVVKDDEASGTSETAIYENGFDENTPQRTWSVAKSIAATVIGAAIHRGDACLDRTMPTPLTSGAGDPRDRITLDHLLRMASGRYSDTPGNRTPPLYWGGTTVDERAANWPLVYEPGTVFRYANNDSLMAVQSIECSFEENPPPKLFAQLGMNHTIAETDWQGNYVLSSQAWTTARDLARLGQLYLDDGVLPDGTRVLPEGWRDYVSDPSGPQPVGRDIGYGAGWWTTRRLEGNAFEDIPDDTFSARGRRGQYLVIVPSRNVVIVRRGEDPGRARFDIDAFTRDVLAALE